MTLAFTAYGAAQAKGSMRAFLPRGRSYPVVTDGNRDLKSWQRVVASAAGAALEALPESDRALLTGAVCCDLVFYLPRPQALAAPKHAATWHTKRPDLDKLTRAVFDALTAIVWRDDAQVVDLRTRKAYAAVGAPARVDVSVVTLAPVGALFQTGTR